jgi:hypothetical protein
MRLIITIYVENRQMRLITLYVENRYMRLVITLYLRDDI